MLFSEPKVNYNKERQNFDSDYYSSYLTHINNEFNSYLENEIFFSNTLMEGLLNEDMFLLNENNSDYIKSIFKYLNSSSKYIEDMWDRFYYEHYLTRRETTKFVGSLINGLDGSGNYSFTGYIYSITDENIHIDRLLMQSETQLRGKIAKGDFSDLSQKLDDTDYFNQVRGQIVGKGSVQADDFQRELFRHYRNGRFNPVEITVTSDVKDMIMDSLFNSGTHLNYCTHFKNNILTYIESVKDFFKKIQSILESNNQKMLQNNYSSMVSEPIKLTNIHELLNLQFNITRKLIQIYTLAFSAKLDAINERQRQYTKAVKAVMSQQQKDRGDTEDDE